MKEDNMLMPEEKDLLSLLQNYKKLKDIFPNEPLYQNYYEKVKESIKKIEHKKIRDYQATLI